MAVDDAGLAAGARKLIELAFAVKGRQEARRTSDAMEPPALRAPFGFLS